MAENTHSKPTGDAELAEVSRRQFIASAVAAGAVLSTGGLGLFTQKVNAEEKTMVKPVVTNGVAWYNAKDWGVEGKGWQDTEAFYDRFPARAKSIVRSAVWNLSKQSAGMIVTFETNATKISARWVLTEFRLAMPHMAATGVSGVDLYAQQDDGTWHWLATGQPDLFPRLEKQLVDGLEPKMRRYRLHLPLYNGVSSVEIGVAESATFNPVAPRTERPIVFYGSSITQGAVASRPGMPYPTLLGRRLNLPIVNLGFSGNGVMEPEVAKLLAELDPCVYMLDGVPNMSAAQVDERYEYFVRILRNAHPDTPIILVEDRATTDTPFLPAKQSRYADTRRAVRAAVKNLENLGIGNLHFIPRDLLYGTDGEASVDGSHPTDLGFWRMCDVFEPVLRSVLKMN